MCVVCKTKKEKTEFLRVVLRPDKTVEVDQTGKMPGRGAYVCNNSLCLSKASNAPLLDRGLKSHVGDRTKEIIKHRAQDLKNEHSVHESSKRKNYDHHDKRVTDESLHRFIGMAEKAGKVISGYDAVEHAMIKNLVKLVVVAHDTSDSTKKRMTREADKKSIKYITYSDKAHLGECIGKSPKALIAITDEHFSSQLLLMMRRLEQSNHHDI